MTSENFLAEDRSIWLSGAVGCIPIVGRAMIGSIQVAEWKSEQVKMIGILGSVRANLAVQVVMMRS